MNNWGEDKRKHVGHIQKTIVFTRKHTKDREFVFANKYRRMNSDFEQTSFSREKMCWQ